MKIKAESDNVHFYSDNKNKEREIPVPYCTPFFTN